MLEDDEDEGWPLLLRTGFGNIFDVGYGWNHAGQVLIATALNAMSMAAEREAWAAVERFCKRKTATSPAC